MPTYERRTTVQAPLEEVWDFHSRAEGLEALTPDWMGLRVEAAMGPDGEADPETLEEGAEISLSIRPFGIGPRQHWTSVITDRERRDGSAYFRDEMVHGPFAFDSWEHTHAFYADGDRTIVRDRVEYELPMGALGEAASPFSTVGFEAMFRERHQRTKTQLEGGVV
ncbi:SRPBCC family protein [Halobiforma nitratireducens]|uniref:Cyclase/dehydrase n=1 Tax=Halobiforma nitratireducens JCM 10879 TaxID=1227454 RepID=M0MIT1_9EURY|nr:SRPBCC family protein [Halobiforma nitratireducens]EMA44634.1 cyclase/dehydrase [Halobiforma nitratireducens JCM 10879]